MGSAASAGNKYRLQNASPTEVFKICQELSGEHQQLLLKALETEEGKITVPLGEGSTWVDNLRDYFEKQYRQGGEFHHPDYEYIPDAQLHTWLHRLTGIQVWRDAIDLTSGEGGEVYFHYTSELGFRNITAPSKEAAEVWASLNSDPGPKQNAWWGKGVYSVPLPPDQWRDREQLLDNNFRNMMARDRAAPDKGPEYVEAEYPKRVAFCVPIIIDAADAYDVSVRATPEMEAAGKEPGRNLGDKLLNAPGMPRRCCVVLRVNGENGVKHAQGQLLDALRLRSACSTDLGAKERLGDVLWRRGLSDEALPILQEVLKISESKYGPESPNTLVSMCNLAILLRRMGRHADALELQRKELKVMQATCGLDDPSAVNSMGNMANTLLEMGHCDEALELHGKVCQSKEKSLGAEHPETLMCMHNWARVFSHMGRYDEAAEIYGQVVKIMKKTLGEQHPATLLSTSSLGCALDKMGQHSEAAELLRKTLEMREATLGAEHPGTLNTMVGLGTALRNLGNCTEAENLHRRALEMREHILGAEHSDTLDSLSELAVTLHRQGQLKEAMEMQRRAFSSMEKALGPDHSDTKESQKRLEDVLRDLALKEGEVDKPS